LLNKEGNKSSEFEDSVMGALRIGHRNTSQREEIKKIS
jgi:hypothetical protein